MSSDLHQQAKEVFAELIDLSLAERSEKIADIRKNSSELAAEVESLLEYHTIQSLVVPPSSPKIRTRSTLSTTYHTRSWKWLSTPFRAFLVGLPFLIACILLTRSLSTHVHNQLESNLSEYLNETVNHRLSDLRAWEREREEEAMVWSQNPDVSKPIQRLVSLAQNQTTDPGKLRDALLQADCAEDLRKQLQSLTGSQDVKYAVWDRRMITLCDWNQQEQPDVLGKFVTSDGAALLTPVLNGEPRVVFPRTGSTVTVDYRMETKGPILSVIVPIFDDSNEVIAALLLRGFGLDTKYQAMLDEWSEGSQDEVYLVNRRRAILSRSRYPGLIEKLEDYYGVNRKIPLIQDPGTDLADGMPTADPSTWPPTLMANQLSHGRSGFDTKGYRNYVGKKVVGAWRWIPDHDIGIALEREFNVAYRVSSLVSTGLNWVTGLFGLGLLTSVIVAAVSSAHRRQPGNLREVGHYQVQELLGEGGMGKVYLAEHALLCRQSAVKVLTHGHDDLSVIGRFEREVQLASQLTHPNTIAIYDFGRNKDGYFFYAMEYINGGHLGQLVEFSGAIEPGRCIYILKQLCYALNEAHQAGVVHRDIKPQNIMVCNRGGEPDFVKLFDYGLVKSFAPGISHNPSQTQVVVGTPRFMAPERLNAPWLADPRVDIYSVGALAYYLLTAQLPPLVTHESNIDLQQTGVETLDLPMNVVEFGEILSACLAVEPSARPTNMMSLIRELEDLSKQFPWTRDESVDWWNDNESKFLLLVQNRRKKLKNSRP